MRSYLLEPQALFIPQLERVLGEAGLEVIGTGATLHERTIVELGPELVFVDVDFLEGGGPNALCRLRDAMLSVAIVAYTSVADPLFEAWCYIAGATVVIGKWSTEAQTIEALRGLARDRLQLEYSLS
jgi:DNA-binding NarL/FixJ family response regulator